MHTTYKTALTSMYALVFYAVAVFSLPIFAFAADVDSLLNTARAILDPIIPILITLALVFFFWGLAQYILKADSPEERASARQTMLYGVLALFVMVSVWGLVAFLQQTLEVEGQTTIDVPSVPR